MSDYYVYAYLDPRHQGLYKYDDIQFEFQPFYIGKGHGGRKFDHLREAETEYDIRQYGEGNQKCNRIRAIIKETGDYPIIIEIKNQLEEDKAFELEKELIVLIGRDAFNEGPLTNLVVSDLRELSQLEEMKRKIGGAVSNRFENLENRREHSKMMKEVQNRPKVKAKKSKTTKKTMSCPEVRKKLSKSAKNRWKDPEERSRISKKRREYYQDSRNRKSASESAIRRFENQEEREKQRIRIKSVWTNTQKRENIISAMNSPEAKEKKSESVKKSWEKRRRKLNVLKQS